MGVIAALGSAVTGFTEGQRVAVNAVTPCFECSYCQRGFTSQCGGLLGGYKYTAQVDGNMAEYFLVPAARGNLAPIPDELSDDAAVYACDMLSTGLMGAEHAQIEIGDTVAIFAQGAVGLCATIGAKLRGAGRIIAVESRPERIALAQRFGADDIVDFTAGDPVAQIMDLTGGVGWIPRSSAWLPADLRGRVGLPQGRWHVVEHRLSRREPGAAATGSDGVGTGHGRQDHSDRIVYRW